MWEESALIASELRALSLHEDTHRDRAAAPPMIAGAEAAGARWYRVETDSQRFSERMGSCT
jgi:hypothetical protein